MDVRYFSLKFRKRENGVVLKVAQDGRLEDITDCLDVTEAAQARDHRVYALQDADGKDRCSVWVPPNGTIKVESGSRQHYLAEIPRAAALKAAQDARHWRMLQWYVYG